MQIIFAWLETTLNRYDMLVLRVGLEPTPLRRLMFAKVAAVETDKYPLNTDC